MSNSSLATRIKLAQAANAAPNVPQHPAGHLTARLGQIQTPLERLANIAGLEAKEIARVTVNGRLTKPQLFTDGHDKWLVDVPDQSVRSLKDAAELIKTRIGQKRVAA